MDALDLVILRAIGLHPFEPWSSASPMRVKSVAREAKASEKTVRDRVRKLERSGVLVEFEAYPNLRHLGLTWSTFHYVVSTRQKARALAAIEDVEGVVGIQDHVGEDLYVDLYYASEEEMRLRMRLLKTLLGEGALDRIDHEMPAVRRALTPLDRRIIIALRGRARRTTAGVARELGISKRTAERRIAEMTSARDLYVVPRIDWSRAPHLLPYALLVEAEEGAVGKLADAAPRMSPGCCRGSWAPTCCEPSASHVTVALYATSLVEMEEQRMRYALAEGVQNVRVLLPSTRREPRAWLDALLRRFAEEPGAKATRPAARVSRTNASRAKST